MTEQINLTQIVDDRTSSMPREATIHKFPVSTSESIISHWKFAGCLDSVNMAADGGDMTFALPDLSGLSEAERLQVMAVMQRAKVGVSSMLTVPY